MCGYNPFYWYEQQLDNDFIEQKRKDAEMLKTIPKEELKKLVKSFDDAELKIVFEVCQDCKDKEMEEAIKQECKERGNEWILQN